MPEQENTRWTHRVCSLPLGIDRSLRFWWQVAAAGNTPESYLNQYYSKKKNQQMGPPCMTADQDHNLLFICIFLFFIQRHKRRCGAQQ